MSDYGAVSDHEINRLVATALGYTYRGLGWIDNADGLYSCIEDSHGNRVSLPDYCNDPHYAWSIIKDNKIWLRELYGVWDCKGFPNPRKVLQVQHSDANPLRAAMVVFLLMKENE